MMVLGNHPLLWFWLGLQMKYSSLPRYIFTHVLWLFLSGGAQTSSALECLTRKLQRRWSRYVWYVWFRLIVSLKSTMEKDDKMKKWKLFQETLGSLASNGSFWQGLRVRFPSTSWSHPTSQHSQDNPSPKHHFWLLSACFQVRSPFLVGEMSHFTGSKRL